MKIFKNCNSGMTLIEVIIAIALVGVMLTGLMGLQLSLLSTTFREHRKLEPIIILKNFWYSVQRKIEEGSQEKRFQKQADQHLNMQLKIELIKFDKSNEKIPDLLNLDYVNLMANYAGQETKLIYFTRFGIA